MKIYVELGVRVKQCKKKYLPVQVSLSRNDDGVVGATREVGGGYWPQAAIVLWPSWSTLATFLVWFDWVNHYFSKYVSTFFLFKCSSNYLK